jgi:GTP-binding protein
MGSAELSVSGVSTASEFSSAEREAGRLLFAQPWDFATAASSLESLPKMRGVEIAFAGRSNVGKSSLINALTGVKDLARASNTPGRTRELNFFDIGGRLTLVDMPGYGYARAAKKEVKQWQSMLRGYLRGRPGLTRAFVLIDSRHGVLEADQEMFKLLDESAVAYQLVLTKTDKIKPGELAKVITETEAVARKRPAAFPAIHVTSSEKDTGLAELATECCDLPRRISRLTYSYMGI